MGSYDLQAHSVIFRLIFVLAVDQISTHSNWLHNCFPCHNNAASIRSDGLQPARQRQRVEALLVTQWTWHISQPTTRTRARPFFSGTRNMSPHRRRDMATVMMCVENLSNPIALPGIPRKTKEVIQLRAPKAQTNFHDTKRCGSSSSSSSSCFGYCRDFESVTIHGSWPDSDDDREAIPINGNNHINNSITLICT